MKKFIIVVISLMLLVLCGCPSPEAGPTSNTSSPQPVTSIPEAPVRTLSPGVVASYDFGERAIMASIQEEIAGESYLFLGTYLEAEQNEYTLQILSLSEPEKPMEVGSLFLESPENNIFSITLSSTVLIVSTLNELWLVDVSIPEKPTLLSRMNYDFPMVWPVIIGDTAYCNTGTKHISAVDISDATQPKDLGFVYEESEGGILKSYGSFLYGLSKEGLHIYESSSRPLQEIGFYADPTGIEEEVTAGMDTEHREKLEKNRFMWVEAAGNYVYLACGFSGLRVIDVADPSQPKEVAHLDFNGTLDWLDISGSYAYVFNTSRELRKEKDVVEVLIVDISEPETPRVADSILLPENWDRYPVVTGDYIYYFFNIYGGRDTPTTFSMQIIDIHAGFASVTEDNSIETVNPVNRGSVWSAVERTLGSYDESNPVKDDLIKRGLVSLGKQRGHIDVEKILELVREEVYVIDEQGYLQFEPAYTPQ